MKETGGQILAKALHAQGVDTVFCVAGESYLPFLDAVLAYPDIKVITCRHESGATFMAEAYGQLTGKPGIAFVTRGPGACNGSIGIHAARQSCAPVIMFSGLIDTKDRDKDAFQEFDIAQMFDSLAKWATVIERVDRIDSYVAQAFNVALTGQPGPVVLGLPEDVIFGATEGVTPARPFPLPETVPTQGAIAALLDILKRAERPFAIVGGNWDDARCREFEDFANRNNLPVAAALRRQDIFDHKHRCYAGELGFGPNPKLVQRIKQADVVLAMGSRLDEITLQGYALLQPGQTLVHVYPEALEFGRSARPDLAVQAHSGQVAAVLADKTPGGERWKKWCDEARAEYDSWTAIEKKPQAGWQGADMTQVFAHLRDVLPQDAIVTTDAGNFSGWAQRYLHYGRPGRALAPVSGAMGYGVPSAIAASLAYPERIVLGICGDGGFMMTASELATAVHHEAKPIIMACNNGMYGTIRMHQERDYPGRHSATALTNPDFVKLGESYGFHAARAQSSDDFPAVWEAALKSGKAALIEIRMDPRQISTTSKA